MQELQVTNMIKEKQMTIEDLIKNLGKLNLSISQEEYAKALLDLAYRLGRMEASLEITEFVKENYEN